MITIYWLLACLAFTLVELAAFTGFATMAAIAALITAGLTLVPSITLPWQIVCWVVLTTAITWLCRKWLFKPEQDALDSEQAIAGAVGEVIQLQGDRAVAMFPRPLKGQVQWAVKSQAALEYEQRIEVIRASDDGRSLEVRPVKG